MSYLLNHDGQGFWNFICPRLVVNTKLAHRPLLHLLVHGLIVHKTSNFAVAKVSRINPNYDCTLCILYRILDETFNVSLGILSKMRSC